MRWVNTMLSGVLLLAASLGVVSAPIARAEGGDWGRPENLPRPPSTALGFPSRAPDLDVLSGFQNPPAGYGEVPFWWWTGDPLDKDRLLWQIEELHRRLSGEKIDSPGTALMDRVKNGRLEWTPPTGVWRVYVFCAQAKLMTLNPMHPQAGQRVSLTAEQARGGISLNLGDVAATAETRVNGRSAGIRVAPPWAVDISEHVKPGENRIEILVYNTLANHYLTIPTRSRGSLRSGLLGPVRLEMQPLGRSAE